MPPEKAQLDPFVHEFAESFVFLGLSAKFIHAIRPDEPADLFTPVNVGEFFIRTMPLGVIGIHAATFGSPAHLVLPGYAAGVHRAKLEQGLPDGFNFSFPRIDFCWRFHYGYDMYHIHSMGAIERVIDQVSRDCRRRALERLVQRGAHAQPMNCPQCRGNLQIEEHGRGRTVNSSSGIIRFDRSSGYCSACKSYAYPADPAFGLHERAAASPRVQEICAWMALRAPAGQAEKDVSRMTDVEVDASTLHREARRQGERAMALRDAAVAMTRKTEGWLHLASRARQPSRPFTLVIQIDAWNIREWDNWGMSETLREAGKEPGRWTDSPDNCTPRQFNGACSRPKRF